MVAVPYSKRPLRRSHRGVSWIGFLFSVLALVVVVVGASYWVWQRQALAGAVVVPITSKVSQGLFLHEVTERGETESSSNVEVRCQVQSKATTGTPILWIIPEGTIVEPGEKLIELDASALRETETQQRILYEQARAAKIQAELAHETSKIAIEEYEKGTFIQEKETVEGEIFLAEENLRRSQDYASYSDKLYGKGYVTAVQLEADKFAVKNAELALATAKTKKFVLENFTRAKMINQLKSAEQTAEAQKRAQAAGFRLEEEKLKFVEDQIAKCVIRAPDAGLVVYANKTDSRGNSEMVIEEGVSVREQQVVIRLPDVRKMQVKVRVNESRVDLIKVGRPARILVDALQGTRLEGVVTRVDALPLPTSWSRGNVKDYAVLVAIDQPPPRLKPGMTAEVSILVTEEADVLQVPVQAVLEQAGKFYLYRYTETGTEPVPVTIGPTNDQFVVIRSGIALDESVVLDPRSYLRKLDPTSSAAATTRFVTSAPQQSYGKGAGEGAGKRAGMAGADSGKRPRGEGKRPRGEGMTKSDSPNPDGPALEAAALKVDPSRIDAGKLDAGKIDAGAARQLDGGSR